MSLVTHAVWQMFTISTTNMYAFCGILQAFGLQKYGEPHSWTSKALQLLQASKCIYRSWHSWRQQRHTACTQRAPSIAPGALRSNTRFVEDQMPHPWVIKHVVSTHKPTGIMHVNLLLKSHGHERGGWLKEICGLCHLHIDHRRHADQPQRVHGTRIARSLYRQTN